jgi:hypothetical protein
MPGGHSTVALALREIDQNDPDALIAAGFCGAKTRNPTAKGPYCRHVAGKRTEHLGVGRCWLHGGNSKVTHGRYSSVKNTELADLISEQEEDPALFDTTSDIATVRALFVDFINRYDEYSAALLAWYNSFTPAYPHRAVVEAMQHWVAQYEKDHGAEAAQHWEYKIIKNWVDTNLTANPRPTQILDVSEAYKMLGEVTKMVERVGKLHSANAVSRKEFMRIMLEIGNIIDQTVTDDRTKTRIRDKMGSLRLA